ncbi:MAG: glycoside hydrolase, partial [Phycisphaerae bacterium]|nr:glycoside hydrolase [Phycisphaerae bacterium]
WKSIVFKKPAAFCNPPGSPDTEDDFVYIDECVNFLVSQFGYASTVDGVKAYALDNEPALWPSTHPRIHPADTGCQELLDRSVALSSAVKDVDATAQIFGPALYGFGAFYNLQSAPDWKTVKAGHSYSWFIDYYLDEMKTASNNQGRRLLDVLDLHWYPEAQDADGIRITEDPGEYTQTNAEARMQAPRSLWDPDYVEKSWIGQWYRSYLPLLPKVIQSINSYYPSTKLAITEYDYGGTDHISGGIAMADVLGIFGKYGLYFASYWGGTDTYISAAYRIYRNYDGNKSTFGDTRIVASMSDKVNSSIYGSMNADNPNRIHLVVLNKNYTQPIRGTFNITSPRPFSSAQVWAFDAASASITERTPVVPVFNNSFTYTIPPLTACHVVVRSEQPVGDLSGNCRVGIGDLMLFLTQWLNEIDCSGPACPDLNADDRVDLLDLALMAANWDSGTPCR